MNVLAAGLRWQPGFIVFLLVMACQGHTCQQGEMITVRYRGTIPVEPKGQVTLNSEPVGFIESLEPKSGYTRVVVRVRKAGEIHRLDRFLPAQDTAGRHGFRIAHFGGDPLQPGDEIEADERLAPIGGRFIGRAMGGAADSVTRSTRPPEGFAPPSVARPSNFGVGSMAKMLRVAPRRAERLDPLVVNEYEALHLAIERAQTPEELQSVIEQQAVPLRISLERARQQAIQIGDRMAEHEYHRMLRMLEHVQRKASVAARAATNRTPLPAPAP